MNEKKKCYDYFTISTVGQGRDEIITKPGILCEKLGKKRLTLELSCYFKNRKIRKIERLLTRKIALIR